MDQSNNKMIRLDFGPYGVVNVPPEVAMSFLSDQGIKDRVREEIAKIRNPMRMHREKEVCTPLAL